MTVEVGSVLHVSFLYYEDCPSHETALARLQEVLAEEQLEAEIAVVRVDTDDQAQQWAFVGSPTIRIEGRDIDPPPANAQYALTCRAYRREDGRVSPLPPQGMIRRALRDAIGAAHR